MGCHDLAISVYPAISCHSERNTHAHFEPGHVERSNKENPAQASGMLLAARDADRSELQCGVGAAGKPNLVSRHAHPNQSARPNKRSA